MGTGKSTLGRAIAQAWKRPFRDTDKIIQEREGRTIPEIFAQDGEAAFRGLEKRCVEAVSYTHLTLPTICSV